MQCVCVWHEYSVVCLYSVYMLGCTSWDVWYACDMVYMYGMCGLCALWYVCMVCVTCTYGVVCSIYCGMYVQYSQYVWNVCGRYTVMCSVVCGVICVVWLVLSCTHSLSDEAIFKDLLTGVSPSALGHCLRVRVRSLFLHASLSCREFSVTDTSGKTREVWMEAVGAGAGRAHGKPQRLGSFS